MMLIVQNLFARIKLYLQTMNIKEKFGFKVKELREQKEYSIEYLANISNVDRTYISDIEKGKRNVSIEIIEKILTSLDTDFRDFFNDKNFKR
ncbi:helix-turn-helix domain-containing protein [Flavobacterium sp. CLA17]|uniref:helix-turn-helix domain-containing protein n=1 Tax=Flavobacterium sp. CLA17 TaxID=2724135 RepID=UPI001F080A31|nr:helix-turn-helix transcriptional regulator [Flavobacterium sp. CLA17]